MSVACIALGRDERWKSYEEAKDVINNETNIDTLREWFPILPFSDEMINKNSDEDQKSFCEIGDLLSEKIIEQTDCFDDFKEIKDCSFGNAIYTNKALNKMIDNCKTHEHYEFILPFCHSNSEELDRLNKIKLI